MQKIITTTDAIQLAQQGDMNALEDLLKKTEKEAYSFLYYLAHDKAELSDMVQGILIKVAKKIKTLKDPYRFKGWLNRLMSNHYYDCMRKKEKDKSKFIQIKENTEEEYENNFKDTKHIPLTECLGSELIDRIKDSILTLNEPYRLAIILREFQGLSYEDIAQITKSNIGTIKSRIARARCQLKETMKEYME